MIPSFGPAPQLPSSLPAIPVYSCSVSPLNPILTAPHPSSIPQQLTSGGDRVATQWRQVSLNSIEPGRDQDHIR